ncbi:MULTISPECIES: hypothetical protein [Streptococcus]|uniref:hypothetical protein n=1 Tax=Bacteria TaxID=2 RepID=UPI0020C8E3EC|nr:MULTISPECIES: hypothetical protein [Streptococcus]MCP9082902.1 hypothetical protein [Streptococcus sp. CF10-1]MCY7083917.1 hypothetical protein [Streptococcus oralis]MCY7087996.1 hypothetical protein [Streptococcus oralis]
MSDSVNNVNNEESVEKVENTPVEDVESVATQEPETVGEAASEQAKDDQSEEVVEEKDSKPEQKEDAKASAEASAQQVVEKAKGLFATKRKEIIAALVAVAVIIVAFVGYNVIQSQPKSLIGDVKVEFSGYEESGTVTYNSQDIAEKVAEIAYQKVGFNKDQAAGLAKKDPIIYAEVSRDGKLASKLIQAEAMISSVHYEFDKTNGLKNGDEVTFTVTTSSKNSPFKAEKKTFKVENLKEYEKVSASDLLTETPVTFTGLNGSGTITITKNSKDEAYFDFENGRRPRNLKNGDKVTLKVKDVSIDSLKAEGKVVDSKTVEVTVEGLKDAKDVKNLIDVLKKNDAYSKELNKNSTNETYTLEPQGSYIGITTGIGNTSSADIDIITVYKVTRKGSLFTNVSYKYYGFDGYELKDDNLVAKEGIRPIYGGGLEDFEVLKEELQRKEYHLIEVKKDEKKSE